MRRVWLFFVPANVAVKLRAKLYVKLRPQLTEAMLGLLLMLYAIAGLKRLHPKFQKTNERPIGVFCGGVNGVLTRLTGSFVLHK